MKFIDGNMVFIDCAGVENEIGDNMYQRSKWNYLIYNGSVVKCPYVIKQHENMIVNSFILFLIGNVL